MPLVHSSHSCTNVSPIEEPVACVPPPPHTPRTDTCLLLRPEQPRQPRRLHCLRSLFVALSQRAAKSRPCRSPPRFPSRGKRGKSRAAPAPNRDTRSARGGAAAPLQLLAGKKESRGAEGQPGKLGSGEPGGVEREHTRRGERGTLDRAGWAEPAGAWNSGGKRRTTQAAGA